MFTMKLQASHRSGEIVLRTKDLQVGYPETLLFVTDDIEVRRQECAALIGPNGSGKTTFIKTILEQTSPRSGEVLLGASLQLGYFAQAHDDLDLDNTLLDELLRHRNMTISEARSYLARFLFRKDDVYKQINTLSGGERGRLALAILALQEANFLMLDEPTNHLDIPAQEVLQNALENFDGTILLVSHDRYLINKLATQIWELDDGTLSIHKGSYQEYLEKRDREIAAKKEEAAIARVTASRPSQQDGSQPSKNTLRKQAEQMEKIEALISETEAKLAQLGEELQRATQSQTFDKIQSLSVEYNLTETQLANLFKKWEKLAHE